MKKTVKVIASFAVIIGIFYVNSTIPRPQPEINSLPEAVSTPATSIPTTQKSAPWQESYAWSQLQDVFNSCKLYWEMNGSPCALEEITELPYLFSETPSDRNPDEGFVEVELISGDPEDFEATARHENSQIVWTIDANGETTCSLGSSNACWNASHLSRKEVTDEVKSVFGDDVPDNARSMEIKGTFEEPYVEFQLK